MRITPTNLILYGPPGTGKTYATAKEAVAICGEYPPKDRESLMQIYRKLLDDGRIEFVTFHQSMSYEDFVEGRQPVTGSDNGEEGASAGFRLETKPGVFREIAERASNSPYLPTGSDEIKIGKRRVFKIEINEDDVFKEALDDNCVMLGGDGVVDIDLTEKYCDGVEGIVAKFGEMPAFGANTPKHDIGRKSPEVARLDQFRNVMEQGSIVIVSKNHSLFRAIGEITGDYDYRGPKGGHPHRRAVRWHWVDCEGVKLEEINTNDALKDWSICHFDGRSESDTQAVERYLNSKQPFVLIIDEINRANISKVFGELITLLEPDKRLGQPNALKVRLPYSGDKFGVPSNLHILGTMNTADRSIALLDTALRRRFTFREMMPESLLLPEEVDEFEGNLRKILDTLNARIEYLLDREHQIGHAYFINCGSKREVDAVMRDKVIPLLAEYFFEDWGKVAAVLGDGLGDEEIEKLPVGEKKQGGFLEASVLEVPPGLQDGEDGQDKRLRWKVRPEKEGFAYKRLTQE